MPNPNDSPDEISRQMAEIRSRLHYDMSQVVAGATTASDWKTYVKARPWVSLGTAFAVGYLLVPRRQSAAVPAAVISALTAAPAAPEREPEAPPKPLWLRMMRTGLSFATPLVLRAAQGFALREVESFLERRPESAPPPMGPSPRPTPAGPARGGGDAHRRF